MAGDDGSDGRRSPADAALLLDVMLGKLATYLRMCGYDAAYALDRSVASDEGTAGDDRIEADDRLLELAASESRLLVTRDAELARRATGLLLESTDVTDQLRELAAAGFELALSEPSRCAECNSALVAVGPDAETPEYAPDTEEFRVWRCPNCGRHYWKGSHWESVEETLSGL